MGQSRSSHSPTVILVFLCMDYERQPGIPEMSSHLVCLMLESSRHLALTAVGPHLEFVSNWI